MGLRTTIDMKIGLTQRCTLMGRERRRSVYTLDEVRPFLSLAANAGLNQICVTPPLPAGRVVAPAGVGPLSRAFCRVHAKRQR